ncbi:MAG: helix-turn-helix domain-containing protein [Candidatus Nanoarchaeia archaeon]|nr:helix-turn-helix domain-containing protein [Candidatus Nanoarchaeia archaeon]
MNESILEEIGLTKNEIKTYLALIKLGSSTTGKIIENTGLHRAIVYDTLEKLIQKGIVSFIIQNNRKVFKAYDPERLSKYLEEKQNKLKIILPELIGMYKTPKISIKTNVYEGKEGIKTIFEDILKTKPKFYYVFASYGGAKEILPFYLEHFYNKSEKLGIELKGILIDTLQGRERGKEISIHKNVELKYMPKEFVSPATTYLYDNKVIFIIWSKAAPMAIMIENKSLYESFLNYFNILWKICKK